MSLGRQGSLYNLTLDEVQNQLGSLGKPLGSMNLDELLNSVLNAEAHQGSTEMGIGNNAGQQPSLPGSYLGPHGSLELSRDLSKKTVEEVWREIQEKKNGRQQSTFGEMTLEDFLRNAAVVAKNSPPQVDAVVSSSPPQSVSWMPYQLTPVQHPQQHLMAAFFPSNSVPQPFAVANPILESPYPETQMTVAGPDPLMPSHSGARMGTLSNTKAPGRKRVAHGDVVEKTVERKQNRMIKNRESAARSRARRQAYTNELENKVSRLEEENERLRRQKEFKLLSSVPPPEPEPKYKLRRTSSTPF